VAIVFDDNGEWCSVKESAPIDFAGYLRRRHGAGGSMSDRQREILAIIGNRRLVEENAETGERRVLSAGWHATESIAHCRTGPTGRRIGWRTLAKRLAAGGRVKLAYGWVLSLA